MRTTYPTIKKSIAVIMGRWSESSRKLMESFGVELIYIPFIHMVNVLSNYGVDFEWEEGDTEAPMKAWTIFEKIDEKTKRKIAKEILKPYKKRFVGNLKEAIEFDVSEERKYETIEILVKTDQGEYIVRKFDNVTDLFKLLLTQVGDDIDFDRLKGG